MSDPTTADPLIVLKERASQLRESVKHNRKQTWICHRMAEMEAPNFIGITFSPGEEAGKSITLDTVFDDGYVGIAFKKSVYDVITHLFHQYSAYALTSQAELDDIERQLRAIGEMDTGPDQ